MIKNMYVQKDNRLWLKYGIRGMLIQIVCLVIGWILFLNTFFNWLPFQFLDINILAKYLIPIDNSTTPWIDIVLVYPIYIAMSFAIGALFGKIKQINIPR